MICTSGHYVEMILAMATNQNGLRWYQRQRAVVGLAVIALAFGLILGGLADSVETADLELEIAELTSERDELEDTLALSPSVDELEQLTNRIGELEDQLLQARSEAAETLAKLSHRENEITRREEALNELESELRAREDALAELESELSAREQERADTAADTPPETRSEPEGGCQAGQVDINTASIQELQRIYEIGPARAEQIVALRPFGSVDELTRVSGIAEGRLGGIKAQGLACVD